MLLGSMTQVLNATIDGHLLFVNDTKTPRWFVTNGLGTRPDGLKAGLGRQ